MQITYMVPVNGEYVDLRSLPEDEQQRIKEAATKTIAEAIAKEEAKVKVS